jgi:hypothetical protein
MRRIAAVGRYCSEQPVAKPSVLSVARGSGTFDVRFVNEVPR